MPYVGNEPTSNFASVTKDAFSGDGSTTAFTLSKAATTNGVAVFVENVRQEPTTAYAVSGTTLTFTAAPVSASGNNIYVLHHNAPASTANHPASQDLTAVKGTFSSILKTDDTTDATSTTDGSLQTDGGLSVAKDAVIGDDLTLKSDSSVLAFGADADVKLTHVADTGLILAAGNQTTSDFGTPATGMKDFVIGGDGNVGMSILTTANNNARLAFGDVDDVDACQLNYHNNTGNLGFKANAQDILSIGTYDAVRISTGGFANFTLADNASVTITSGAPNGAMLVLLTVASTGYANLFFVSWVGSEFNITGDTNFAVSDTDNKMACVFSGGSAYSFTLKNTRGGDTAYHMGVLAG